MSATSLKSKNGNDNFWAPLSTEDAQNTKIQEGNYCTCHSSAEFSVEEEVEAVEAGPENI
jgi:hypothetical protein